MLAFQDVSKEYRLDEENTIAPVRNLSLEVDRGEFIVIIGRSGTGKTTLLNLAAGLVKPTSGKVVIDSTDLSAMSDTQVSALRSRKVGFIFQFPSLLPSLTIKDNVALPAIFTDANGTDGAAGRAAQLLDTLGLGGKLDVYPRQLSAGEQKRAVIARSLMNEPQLILADEPTSDLDVRTEREVMSTLRSINSRGVTFLVVTHSLELVAFATRAFEMEDGHLNCISTEGANGGVSSR
jgi:ABC-type lipoprotein export system ATPase subunit